MNKLLKLFSLILFILISGNISLSQTVYTWNGSVNSSFSTGGNWTPFRQIGLVTDILVFENSGNVNVTNVYQVTVGQLIVKNNTNLTMAPASGNAKLLTIKGVSGEDLVVESGSSLKIFGNDPSLNFFVGTGATASISGNMSMEGAIAHYLNAADPMAIRFKSGSTFSQLCPGSIFNTVGISNAVVFESGSNMKINHPAATNPFGLAAPNSKVLFENSSILLVTNISTLSLSGRSLADLTVEQGSYVNIAESFTADLSVTNIIVKNGGTLIIKNNNVNYIPTINIRGNISSEGSFNFSDAASSKLNVKMTGTSLQTISGSGVLLIPVNLNSFELCNTISLQRNLAINCPLVVNRYEIITNGFEFSYNPEFGNPFHGTKTTTLNASIIEGKTDEKSSHFSSIPAEYSVSQNYPNPFNPSTKIDFSLPADSKVTLQVYDITGREVALLVNSFMTAGTHTIDFDASALSSGVYFYNIKAGTFTKTVKMILAK
ncbi:MAG: T9SS type A sorting domain-containing protein [Ignavibacteria bacterium]|nr:T9SS type A sorting domain-containing protein [Ignavibacteria bacterium]